MPTNDDAERMDRVFRALASRPRREILRLLATGGGRDDARCCSDEEVCACVFSEKLGLGAPTVSHHMKALLDAGLVSAEKRGLWVYYRLRPDAVRGIAGEMLSLAGCDVQQIAGACKGGGDVLGEDRG